MAIDYPPIFINNYLAEKVRQGFIDETLLLNTTTGVSDNPIPQGSGLFSLRFFPTSPTDIDALTQGFPTAQDDVFAVYDRMFKMRRTPFPHIKCEQLLYYFYKMSGDPVALIKTSQLVQDLLDRGDESAQELNSWIARQPRGPSVTINGQSKPTVRFGQEDFLLPYFHEIKIYQLEETRDIIDFGTARTYAGNKIIIDYDWHSTAQR